MRLFLAEQDMPQPVIYKDTQERQEEPQHGKWQADLAEEIKRYIGIVPDMQAEHQIQWNADN